MDGENPANPWDPGAVDRLCAETKFRLVTPQRNPATGMADPPGRSGHCAAADEANMYVYGGFNPKAGPKLRNFTPPEHYYPMEELQRQVMAELWAFNFATRTWRLIETEGIPDTAASSCMLLLGQKLFLYGGTVVPWGSKMSNNLYVLDLQADRKIWTQIDVTPDKQEEGRPFPGYGQSMVFHEGSFYLFTGAIQLIGHPVSHLHRLDMRDRHWRRLFPKGQHPEGRYKQEIIMYKDRMYLIGGGHQENCATLRALHVYSFDSGQWECVQTTGDAESGRYPCARACFGCCLHIDHIYIFGGRIYHPLNNEEVLPDSWRIDLRTLQWERLWFCQLPHRLSFPTAVLSPSGHSYIYGGIHVNRERNGKLYRATVFVGQLAELCFDVLMKHIKVEAIGKDKLRDIGLPINFSQRLPSVYGTKKS